MTREEAKRFLVEHCNPKYPDGDKTQWDEAINLAISALEQSVDVQTDTISRQAAEMQWIPVSSGKLPEFGKEVLVTFYNKDIGRRLIGTSRCYCYVQEKWSFTDCPFDYAPIAWMPLPEPYRGDDHDEG